MGWPRRLRRTSAIVAFVAACFSSAAACSIDVGDQACTEDSVATDKDDRCPYGPPGGPKVAGGDCPAVTLETDPTKCTVTWVGDVYPLFKDPAAGNCTASGCHGAQPGAKGVYMPPDDPQSAFIELKGYFNDQQAPYVSDETPTEAWILCNLEGTNGGGSPMPPPSGLRPEALAVVRQWAACGMVP